jgi:long-chain acyl-CoA synthetase
LGGTGRFAWHPRARVFAGGAEVHLTPRVVNGFQTIPARPAGTALRRLGEALGSAVPFCVSDAALPPGADAASNAFITLTGGSSGRPKAIRRSQASWIASFRINAERFGIGPGSRVALLGHLGHSLSLYGLLEALHLGAEAHVLADLSPTRQRARMAEVGADVLYATPTQLRLLAGGTTQALPDLRLILCGGGALDAATGSRIARLCPGAACLVFYGAAETSFITIADAGTPEGSVGRPYPGVTLVLRDGEVWVRSPYLFDGYAVGDGADTRWDGAFLSVGEMGRLDAEGNLWLEGRRSRMVTVADRNVFPEAIEATILGVTGVVHAAVLPRPDALRGHRLVAVIAGNGNDLSERVRRAARAAHDPAPGRVLLHPDFPLLPSGKPDLPALACWLKEQT